MSFKILSIDGGGTRGIIPAQIIHRLEEEYGRGIIHEVDLLAGTSTGGVICLGLSSGLTGEGLVRLYLEHANLIFQESWVDRTIKFDEQFRANYSPHNLRAVLERYFGTRTLGDVHRHADVGLRGKEIMICAFDLNPVPGADRNEHYRPAIFHSSFIHQQDISLVDVGMSTTAAPTYFPIHDQKYIDGGVAMNNPAMAAIAYALNDSPISPSEKGMYLLNGYKGLRKRREEIKVLSIGTGSSHLHRISPEKIGAGNWGNLQWIKYLPQLIIESNVQSSIYYARHVLAPGNFLRIDPIFDDYADKFPLLKGKKVPMDTKDPLLLETMKDLADHVYELNRPAIHAFLRDYP